MMYSGPFQRALARALHTRWSAWLVLCALFLCFSLPNAAHAASISVQVSAGNDDAEERVSDGNMYRNSSDLELVNDGGTQQIVGMRFQSITIPQGATITSAEIQFTVDETNSGATSVLIEGQDSDDAAGFSNTDFDISNTTNRPHTTASVAWNNIPAWTVIGSAGADQATPDLSTIVQEIVNRGGWTSGNDMVFIISGSGERTAESANGGSGGSLAPILRVSYAVPGEADVAITKTDSPDPVLVGDPLSYTLTITNNGIENATGVTVVDPLPASVTLSSAIPSQGSCIGTTTVTCSLGTILNGGSAQVVILVSTTVIGSLSNTATVSANEPDGTLSNNSANETTTVFSGVSQICYVVADSGGGPPGNDLLERVDTNLGTITAIGTGTGTSSIEAASYNSATGVLYGADANQLGTINLSTGIFTALANPFGTADGSLGAVNLSDADGLAYDATTGILYGAHRRAGDDLLFQASMATGQFVPDAFGVGIDYVVVPAVAGLDTVDDITVDPTSGQMYGIMNSNAGNNDRLISINKTTGASADIARVTVGGSGLDDIEGLGVDGTGQLWATTGSNEALYQVNKSNAVATLNVSLFNGQDYEAVDCFSFSSVVTADLAVSKTVDDATPREGDTITYTVTVTNNGPNFATVIQINDALPAGVTFVSSTVSQGVYDNVTGNWFVGDLAATTSATLDINATVDAGTAGSTITNTASVTSLSQSDPDNTNDSDSVDIDPIGNPDIVVIKTSVTTYDPYNLSSNPKAIPGAWVLYTIQATNQGLGPVDNDTTVVTDPIPANTEMFVNDLGGAGSGPVLFVDGATASGLSYTFTSLASTTDDVEFSNDGGTTFTYAPVPDVDGFDSNVTHVRARPKGVFNASDGTNHPRFELRFRVRVK